MSILACQPYVNSRITLVLGLNDRTPTTVVRVSPLRKARRCQNRRPSSKTPHIGRPLLWPAGHYATTPLTCSRLCLCPDTKLRQRAPLSRGRTPHTLDRGCNYEKASNHRLRAGHCRLCARRWDTSAHEQREGEGAAGSCTAGGQTEGHPLCLFLAAPARAEAAEHHSAVAHGATREGHRLRQHALQS